MTGLVWTAAIWAMGAWFAFALRHRAPQVKRFFTRENAALMIALLGTFSIAAETESAEVLAEPVVLERVVRGGLAALALALAAPLLIARLRLPHRRGRQALTALVVYMGVALLSSLYSAAPLVSASKVFEAAAALTAVLAVSYGPEPARRLRDMVAVVIGAEILLMTTAVLGFFLIPAQFAFLESRPGFVLEETLFPPYAHSNAVSASAALLGAYALAKMLSGGRRLVWGGISVMSVVALVLSSGRQGLAIYVVAVAAVLWTLRRKVLLFLLAPAVVATVVTYQDVILDAISRDRDTNFATLTGRTIWWEAALNVWTQHPWLGWGYSAGGRFVALESINFSGVSSIHSGYIELLVGVGILGTVPLAVALFKIVTWSIEQARRKEEVALALLIVPLMIRTGVSLGFGGWLTVELALFMLLAAMVDQARVDRIAPPIATAPERGALTK